ncbi:MULTISPECIES: hypothetical protein [Rhodonellum]|uniref:hypothetical protein n=1 Tax=Rhodonellum TaxID=336827 RepID=UPI001F2323DC|nr:MULTISPECIES: hypothetical protein [Rhodonellum]
MRKLPVALCILALSFFPKDLLAQQEPDGEALLTFTYPALGQVYLNAVFFGDIPFLPMGEVLSLLYIPSERTENGKGLKGTFPGKNDQWGIDPLLGTAVIKGKTEVLSAENFYLGEMDLYLHPDYFSRIFGLNFSTNIYALSISLVAEGALPVDDKQKREALRKRLQQRQSGQASDAPLLYDRERKLIAPGMLDYNLNTTQTESGRSLGLLLNGGMEFLGGDLQGVFAGNLQNGNLFANTSGVRWRYVLPGGMRPDDNVAITSISVGQINTSGFNNSTRLLGVGVTNNPVIPRLKLDVFVIDGYTAPDSEVELLIGGQLVDFLRADEVGYYRFNAPITFGTIRLGIRIYTPQGEVITEDRQLQIPFTFLPKGFVTYNIQAGLPQFGLDSLGTETIGHADIAYGITNALTVRAGVDQGSLFGVNNTYGVFGLSARLLQQYLVNVDILPNRYYQASGSVFYANNTSINAQYTEHVPGSEFNFLGQVRDANLNLFYPFKVFGKFSGFRIAGERLWFENGVRTNYQADINTQIGRVVTRVNYRERINGINDITEGGTGLGQPGAFSLALLTGSMTYTVRRSPSVPVFVRGMFLRGQFRYDTDIRQPQSYSVLLSQTLLKTGRFTLGYEQDMVRKAGQLQVGFLYDFTAIRSSTQFSARKDSYVAQQTFSGSIGIDPSGLMLPTNRDQVTRSGVSVRMFIDKNENGAFDEGEEVVPAKAVRLDRSANMLLGSDGILRITQLQSYWKYEMEVDINALPNPNLAPKIKKFSFIAEPNRFRSIDIPLYQTGIIEGFVYSEQNGSLQGLGGFRLILEKDGEEVESKEVLRTFSDGGFYAYGLLPGKYTLRIDPKQLEFMQSDSEPGVLEFEILALADGDYKENLNFVLRKIPAAPED